MKYIDEYRNTPLVNKIIARIRNICREYPGHISLMEVCGTHTMSLFRSGLRRLLPSNIHLLSGPGCPVCVTPNRYLDRAVAYSRKKNVIITTFGDMMNVPGSSSSLQREKGKSSKIIIVYSCLDALKIARENPGYKVVFLGIGFETTSPTLAAAIKIASRNNIGNFFILSGAKLIPPAMKALLEAKDLKISGFICPGHVSAITGARPYNFIARDYRIPCVITGFEPLDLAQGILMLVKQIANRQPPRVEIQYRRVVPEDGNPKALGLINEVFSVEDSHWRGIGVIPQSGLRIRDPFSRFDACVNIPVTVETTKERKGCICGDILRGVKAPPDCRLFRKQCTPEDPQGACMVATEGTCSAYYKYGDLSL